MKKLPLIVTAIMAAASILTAHISAANTQSTSYTVMMGTDGELQIAQDAYLPTSVYLNLGLDSAEDMYIKNDIMYIADTKNKCVKAFDLDSGDYSIIGENILKSPTGVSADNDGRIYVADIGNKEAYIFAADGELLNTFGKPTEAGFGINSVYAPKKIIPADDGGVYIISEGSYAGIVHMDKTGKFLGYFASESTHMSFFDKIIDFILTDEQKAYFLNKTPPSFENIFRGDDGLVYGVIKGPSAKVNKYSLAGANLLSEDKSFAIDNIKDICVAADGRIIAVNLDGYIYELTRDGHLLCGFGGPADGQDKLGLFYSPSGVGVDSSNRIYVLDKEKNNVQVFSPTPTEDKMQAAMRQYNEGDYDGSMATLKELLKFNNTSFLAHYYMAKNYMQIGAYSEAAEHYMTAKSTDYSDTYSEIRNLWLQKYLIYIVVALLIFVVIMLLLAKLGVTQKASAALHGGINKLRQNKTADSIMQMKYSIMHPIDNAYEVKVKHIGNVVGATVLYLLFMIIFIVFQLFSGFLFSTPIEDYSLFITISFYIGAVILFVAGNNFISSINDGKGTIRSIYIITAYSLSPLIIIMPIVTLASNFFTLNDSFFREAALSIAVIWSIVNLFTALMEIHGYTLRQLIKNIILTVFFMIIAIVVLSLFYLLLKQIFDFCYELIVEVTLRG